MKTIKILFAFCGAVLLNGCAATLLPVSVTKNSGLSEYKYVYITPTTGLTSGSGGVYGGNYGVYGSSVNKSVNPSDIIAGYMMQKGYVQVKLWRNR